MMEGRRRQGHPGDVPRAARLRVRRLVARRRCRGGILELYSAPSGSRGILRIPPTPPTPKGGRAALGGVAQLGERLLCKQEVIGSIPFTSTISSTELSLW